MKSVSMSQVVRSHDAIRFLCPIQSWSQFASLGVTLAAGPQGIGVAKVKPLS